MLRLTIQSGVATVVSSFCEHHAKLVQKKYSGINPSKVIDIAAINAAPVTFTIQ